MEDQGVQPYYKELINLDDYLQDEGFKEVPFKKL